jgi:hypothetical protein
MGRTSYLLGLSVPQPLDRYRLETQNRLRVNQDLSLTSSSSSMLSSSPSPPPPPPLSVYHHHHHMVQSPSPLPPTHFTRFLVWSCTVILVLIFDSLVLHTHRFHLWQRHTTSPTCKTLTLNLLSQWKILSSLILGSLDLLSGFHWSIKSHIHWNIRDLSSLHFVEVLSMTPVRYPCIIFLYSNLIPQHPVPLPSVSPNRPSQSHHNPMSKRPWSSFLTTSCKIVPSILGNSFVFLSLLFHQKL